MPQAQVGVEGLGARLSMAINLLGLTQAEFATTISTSPGFLSEVIHGKRVPGGEFLNSIREAFDINLDWLVSGRGGMSGLAPINPEWFHHILELVAIANAASSGDEEASNVLVALMHGGTRGSTELLDPRVYSANSTAFTGDDFRAAVQIYNSSTFCFSADQRIRSAASFLLTSGMLEVKPKWDLIARSLGSLPDYLGPTDQVMPRAQLIQNIVGKNNRVAGRHFVEARQIKPNRRNSDEKK